MIGALVGAFIVVAACGGLGLVIVSAVRSRLSFDSYRSSVQVLTFTVYFGVWGAIVGGAFWIAS